MSEIELKVGDETIDLTVEPYYSMMLEDFAEKAESDLNMEDLVARVLQEQSGQMEHWIEDAIHQNYQNAKAHME